MYKERYNALFNTEARVRRLTIALSYTHGDERTLLLRVRTRAINLLTKELEHDDLQEPRSGMD